ncbi:hypothetical protein M432DRAFT_641224 [Thermoascus aurantiacus ATCC 26904]
MASGIMATATAIVGTLYYAVYPLLFLISSLLSLLGTLLMPFLHMGRYVLHFSLLPFRVLAKFESLYIFFGVAVLIGIAAGLILHLISTFILRVLQLSSEVSNAPGKKSRSLVHCEAGHSDQKTSGDYYTEWTSRKDQTALGDGRLFPSTIIEEEDDSHSSDDVENDQWQ